MSAVLPVPTHLPLRQQIAFSSVDVDELSLFLDSEQMLEKRVLTILGRDKTIDSHMSNVQARQIQYMGVHLGSNVIASSVPLKVAQIVIPFNGQIVDHTNGNEILALPLKSAIVHNPNYPVKVHWQSDTSALVIRLNEDLLKNVYQAMTQTEMPGSFQLQPYIDLTKGNGLSLFKIIQSIMHELGSDSPFNDNSRAIDLWEELLVTTLLTHQVSVSDELLHYKKASPVYHYVKRTSEYIEDHIQEPIALADLAREAGVSIRSLQMGFKKSLGMGPMAYLRDQKLEQVRDELLLTSPGESNVGDVAARWGFLHPSHFTKIYKLRFGELPSETLNKI